jgi:hypothetical protein
MVQGIAAMTHNMKLNAVLVVAGAALALSIYTAVRAPGGGGAHACIDREARDQTDKLRKALAERDALISRLTRAASAPPGAPPAADMPVGSRLPPPSPSSSAPSAPQRRGPKRYTHFEVPSPAVTVTQKDDGTYDIQTTDPALSGTTMQITAVTATGDEDTLLIRIP